MRIDHPRSSWNPDPRNSTPRSVRHTHLEFHHSVTGVSPWQRVTLGIQRNHLGRGWADIFYSVVLTAEGQLVEARGIGLQSVGTALTVCLLGDLSRNDPTEAQLRTVARIVAETPDGMTWHAERAAGTRYASSCPARLIPFLERLRSNPPQEDVMTPEQEAKLDQALMRLEAVQQQLDPGRPGLARRVEQLHAKSNAQWDALVERLDRLEQTG